MLLFFLREYDKKLCNLIVVNFRVGNFFLYFCLKIWVIIEWGVVWWLSVMSVVCKNILIRFVVLLLYDIYFLFLLYLKFRLLFEDIVRRKLLFMEFLLYGMYWKRVFFFFVLYYVYVVNFFIVFLIEKLVLVIFFVEWVGKWRVKLFLFFIDSNIKFIYELFIIILVKFFYWYLNLVIF